MSSLSTLPKGDSAWLLRKAIERIMEQVSVLETNIGVSTSGNSADTQIIFNDNGTLRGDAGLVYNKTTDTLTAGAATITGDLTVRTNKLKVDATGVGIGTTSPTSGTLSVQTHYLLFPDSQTKIGDNGLVNGVSSDGNSQIQFYGGRSLFFNEGASNTKMTLNSTGLGIGMSPLTSSKLSLFGGTGDTSAADTISSLSRTSSTGNVLGGKLVLTAKDTAFGNLVFRIKTTASSAESSAYYTDALTIDGEKGNVGIGVTPSAWSWRALQVGAFGGFLATNSAAYASYLGSNCYYDGGNWRYIATSGAVHYEIAGGDRSHKWYNAPSGTAGAAITFTQAMTLTAAGEFLVGTTSTSVTNGGVVTYGSSAGQFAIGHATGTSSATAYAGFQYAGTQIGSITQSGTTGVLFNITSDYRLKESVKPISGGLARINALKPSIYNWKSDGSTGEGFLAHELAEVVPFAVTGEKDAVNADGTMKSQGIDMSRIVPILVAAIQELTARVQTLEAR